MRLPTLACLVVYAAPAHGQEARRVEVAENAYIGKTEKGTYQLYSQANCLPLRGADGSALTVDKTTVIQIKGKVGSVDTTPDINELDPASRPAFRLENLTGHDVGVQGSFHNVGKHPVVDPQTGDKRPGALMILRPADLLRLNIKVDSVLSGSIVGDRIAQEVTNDAQNGIVTVVFRGAHPHNLTVRLDKGARVDCPLPDTRDDRRTGLPMPTDVRVLTMHGDSPAAIRDAVRYFTLLTAMTVTDELNACYTGGADQLQQRGNLRRQRLAMANLPRLGVDIYPPHFHRYFPRPIPHPKGVDGGMLTLKTKPWDREVDYGQAALQLARRVHADLIPNMIKMKQIPQRFETISASLSSTYGTSDPVGSNVAFLATFRGRVIDSIALIKSSWDEVAIVNELDPVPTDAQVKIQAAKIAAAREVLSAMDELELGALMGAEAFRSQPAESQKYQEIATLLRNLRSRLNQR